MNVVQTYSGNSPEKNLKSYEIDFAFVGTRSCRRSIMLSLQVLPPKQLAPLHPSDVGSEPPFAAILR